jgi:poly(hydroxyalkanoate) depolymerase family esterase
MKMLDPSQMLEATRLTRAGQLTEAMALLQSMLSGAAVSGDDAQPATMPTEALLPRPMIDAGSERADNAPGPRIARSLHIELPGGHLAKPRRAPRPADICPPGGKFLAGSFASTAGGRSYKLYVPSKYKGEPRPLIVMLHGCTQSPDDFAAGTRMNFAADEHTCFVIYPEQSQAANASKCWNWFKTSDQRRGRGEPELIAGIARQVMKDFKIDARRIYVAGLSAGGAAAAIVGEAYPDLFAAVGVHSGLACGAARDLPSAFAAMRGDTAGARTQNAKHGVPTIVFHGDRDTTVHPRNGEEVIARANSGGRLQVSRDPQDHATQRKYTRSVQLDQDGRAILELWTIHGAGHAWSGGNSAGSFTDPKGPDATKEMLRFFLDHIRSGE